MKIDHFYLRPHKRGLRRKVLEGQLFAIYTSIAGVFKNTWRKFLRRGRCDIVVVVVRS